MPTNIAPTTKLPITRSIRKALQLVLSAVAILACSAGLASAQRYDPFIEPDYFDPDFQFFAPAEVDTYGGAPDPNTGFYFTYDRLYSNVTRPRDVTTHYEGDFTWGNRYNLGFMTEEGHGWLLSFMHIDGPNLDALNEADYSSVEVNKVWRLDELHNGSWVEPFVGLRYTKFIDFTDEPNPVENNIVGGQLGVRWFKKKGRWLLSAEGRLTPAVNFQFFNSQDRSEFAMQGEVRADASYSLTRDIYFNVGYQLNHFGQGIARGSDFNNNSEDLTINSVLFGIHYNY